METQKANGLPEVVAGVRVLSRPSPRSRPRATRRGSPVRGYTFSVRLKHPGECR